MSDVKWIKVVTDIFDDEKILMIEKMPQKYMILVVWFKLLCLAGKQNNSGVFLMGNIPYTPDMLATIFRMKRADVAYALEVFERFGMTETVDGVITIRNWNKHQQLDRLELAREKTRERVANHRKKQKLMAECNVTCNGEVTPCNADRIDKEKEKEGEGEREEDKEECGTAVAELYNSICQSFPSVRSVSSQREDTIRQSFKSYTLDDFKRCFENAEGSSFLKGDNQRGWRATFDWLIKDCNMAKVLDGNFADVEPYSREKAQQGSFDTDEFFKAAVAHSLNISIDEV